MRRDSFSVNFQTPCVSEMTHCSLFRRGTAAMPFSILPLPTASTMGCAHHAKYKITRRFIGGNLRHHNCINASLPHRRGDAISYIYIARTVKSEIDAAEAAPLARDNERCAHYTCTYVRRITARPCAYAVAIVPWRIILPAECDDNHTHTLAFKKRVAAVFIIIALCTYAMCARSPDMLRHIQKLLSCTWWI